MKNVIILIAAGALLAGTGFADYQDFEIAFDEDKFTFNEITEEGDTYDLILYEGGGTYAPVGEPTIPTIGYDVLIPYDSTNVSVQVLDYEYTELQDEYYLYPGQVPKALSNPDPDWEFTEPGDTYSSEDPYPANVLLDNRVGLIRGFFVCQCLFIGTSYIPANETVRRLDSISFRVSWDPPLGQPSATRYEWEHVYDEWAKLFEKTAVNPEDAEDYREPVNYVDLFTYSEYQENGETIPVITQTESEDYSLNAPDPTDTTSRPDEQTFPYMYVIITNDKAYHESGGPTTVNLTQEVGELRDWRSKKGIPATYRTYDWIANNYPRGTPPPYVDKQLRVREFIKDAWKYWGTQYVICIGDVDPLPSTYAKASGQYGVVPIRCFKPALDQDTVPTDVYYCCLDEEWNDDNDNYWGEVEQSEDNEFKPDLALGWVPAQNTNELSEWVDKALAYEKDLDDATINGFRYNRRFLYVGADQSYAWEVKVLKLLDNYIKTAGFNANDKTLLEMTEGYGPGDNPPNGHEIQWPTYPEAADLNDAIDEGYGVIHVGTHGHPAWHYILTHDACDPKTPTGGYSQVWAAGKDRFVDNLWGMRYADSVAELENGAGTSRKYGIAYSTSCHTNHFMKYNIGGGHTVSEEWLFNGAGGGVAYLGDTASAYPEYAGRQARFFYDMLFNKTSSTTDDSTCLGIDHIWSKYRWSLNAHPQGWADWQTVYAHILSGDPDMPVYTADPKNLIVQVLSTDEGPEQTTVRVKVTEVAFNGDPVYLAHVCLYKPPVNGVGGFYLLNITNYYGICEFVVDGSADDASVTATKHNYLPGQANTGE
jgi:hypothetical protein